MISLFSLDHSIIYLSIYSYIYLSVYLSIYLPSLSLSISVKLVFSWDHANLSNSQVKLVFWKVFNLNFRATCVLFCTKRPLPIDLSVNPSVSVRRSVVTESLLSTNCPSACVIISMQRINSLDRVNVREARAGEIDRKMARLIDRSIDL